MHRASWPQALPVLEGALLADYSANNPTAGISAQWVLADVNPDQIENLKQILPDVAEALGRLRKEKSDRKVKQRAEVKTAQVNAPAQKLGRITLGLDDLKAAANAHELVFVESEGELTVSGFELVPENTEQ